MRVGDYFQHRKRLWLRLHEKGGKRHDVPCHPSLESHLNNYIRAAGVAGDNKGRLFRSMHKGDKLTDKPMTRFDVFQMIKRRAKAATLPYSTCCHTFRATGITTFQAGRARRLPSPIPLVAIHFEPPASRPISRTGARLSTLKPLRTTNRQGRLSFTTEPERNSRLTRSKESRSEI